MNVVTVGFSNCTTPAFSTIVVFSIVRTPVSDIIREANSSWAQISSSEPLVGASWTLSLCFS
ncbi:hypothetical protein B0I35DRAFT_447444 [Stachybotrys elegans]|uniref:Uncharacterized protein n=1 Tax=Stachybotrys elegans TaxID=80388 RepID=A0A8K0WJ27_9HYPO|nr:hypothetical protein B0I35DRAFT_447444 [Stachybotrys elegans]